jgi:hypothetical protein
MIEEAIETRSLPSETLVHEEHGIRSLIISATHDPYAAAKERLAKFPASRRRNRYLYVVERDNETVSSRAYWVDELNQFVHHFPNFLKKGAECFMFYFVPRNVHQLAVVHSKPSRAKPA